MIKPDKKQITILVSTILALCSFSVFAAKDLYGSVRFCLTGDVKSNATIRSAGDSDLFNGQGNTAKFTKCTDTSQTGTFQDKIFLVAGSGMGARCTVRFEGGRDSVTKVITKPFHYAVIDQNKGARCTIEEKGTVDNPNPFINITCIPTTEGPGPAVECN